jgi:hypothetical protein
MALRPSGLIPVSLAPGRSLALLRVPSGDTVPEGAVGVVVEGAVGARELSHAVIHTRGPTARSDIARVMMFMGWSQFCRNVVAATKGGTNVNQLADDCAEFS